MDREAIRQRMAGGYRTWRWNQGDAARGYDAVETTARGLRWYRWSHDVAEGGVRDEVWQAKSVFLRDGPPRPAPKAVIMALRAWLEAAQGEHR